MAVKKATTTREPRLPHRAASDAAHFAAIAVEDAIADDCDREWDNLIAHFKTELQHRRGGL